FLARVAATGYAGPVSLEVFNDSFRQADTQRTAFDGLRSLRWLDASVDEASTGDGAATGHATGGRTPGRPAASGPGTHDGTGLVLQPLAQVAAPSGINYVELSTDELGTLTRQLHQLGLRFIGFHRSKPQVQLWRRGSARIIITELDPETAHG